MRIGDWADFYQNYTPPDKLDPRFTQGEIDNARTEAIQDYSSFQRHNEAEAESYEELENQSPTFNDAGDEATYIYKDFNGGLHPRTLVKINGQWYWKEFQYLESNPIFLIWILLIEIKFH